VCHGDGSAVFFVRARAGLQNVVPGKERVNNKNECLTAVLTSVSGGSRDDKYVTFTLALICIIGGDIVNTSSIGKGYEIRSECTGVGKSIKLTTTKNRINR
jgi:hypothetical protein